VEQWLIDTGKQLGPFAVLAIVIGVKAGRAINRLAERFLASFDALSAKVDANTEAVREHSGPIKRIEGKMDGIMDERERTPVGYGGGSPIPERRRIGSEDETPPIRPPIRRMTPVRGVPGGPSRPASGYRPPRPGTRDEADEG